MLPESQPLAPAEPLTISTDAVLSAPVILPDLPPPPGTSGNTESQVTPPAPVTPESGNTPVNPVNQGNTAGLPDTLPEGNTDSIVHKTFKLPTSTVASMERVVQQINEVTPAGQPPCSVHSYGVDLLVRHESARRAIADFGQLRLEHEQLRISLSVARRDLESEQQKVRDLTAQLKQQTDYVNRLEHSPTPSVTPPPVAQPATSTEGDLLWHERYVKPREQVEQMAQKMERIEENALVLQSSLELLPIIVATFCQEAARNTWFTAEYYQWYFNQLVAYYSAQQQ